MTQPRGPREVKIVACPTAQAGTVPFRLMVDLGAEVIKIEEPELPCAASRSPYGLPPLRAWQRLPSVDAKANGTL